MVNLMRFRRWLPESDARAEGPLWFLRASALNVETPHGHFPSFPLSFIFTAMRRASRLAALLTASAALVTGVAAVQKVTRQGRYLYNADGSRFYIKGVAYQPQGTSPYAYSYILT